ncbi:hypothetical protein C8R42DRAFT_686926 [Lentinula raphanica]|nr:hypothetical protein C8R42DRAFT_686926 [Lentinula raphanica]
MAAATTTASLSLAAQLLSTTCDLDDRLDLGKLIPKTQAQKIAFTTKTLDLMTKILESVRDLVLNHGTDEHKNEFHTLSKICRNHCSSLEKLERRIKERDQGSGWKFIFQWNSNDSIRTDLNELQTLVVQDQGAVYRASVMFRAQLVDFGLVTIIAEELPQQPAQQEPQSLKRDVAEPLIVVSSNNDVSNPKITKSQNSVEIIELTFLNPADDESMASLRGHLENQCGDPLGAVTSVGSGQCSPE